jgi:hypothetical protein
MPSPRPVLLTPSKSSALTQLPFCQQPTPVTSLTATLRKLPASVANKRLTQRLNPLDATLTKNTGVGSQPSNLQTFQLANALFASWPGSWALGGNRSRFPVPETQLRDDFRRNSLPLTFLATPHKLTPYTTTSYKNHRGEGMRPLSHQTSVTIATCDGLFPPLRLSAVNCQLSTANCPTPLSRNEQTATRSLLYMHPVLSSPLCLWGIALSRRLGGCHE